MRTATASSVVASDSARRTQYSTKRGGSRIAFGPLLQVLTYLGAIGFHAALDGFDDSPAADGPHRRERAEQKMIARAGHHGRFGFDLDQCRLPTFHRRAR